mmetsp:Transcript_71079/g.206110  ORF Transcript_71079/g.206110 Transcript_71079/m.206110 type:complete len:214 (-) Transcript_71079:1010-1651(-)
MNVFCTRNPRLPNVEGVNGFGCQGRTATRLASSAEAPGAGAAPRPAAHTSAFDHFAAPPLRCRAPGLPGLRPMLPRSFGKWLSTSPAPHPIAAAQNQTSAPFSAPTPALPQGAAASSEYRAHASTPSASASICSVLSGMRPGRRRGPRSTGAATSTGVVECGSDTVVPRGAARFRSRASASAEDDTARGPTTVDAAARLRCCCGGGRWRGTRA